MSTMSDEVPSYQVYVGARWSSLFRFAYLLTADRNDAEDLLQRTLVKAYLKWDRVAAAESVDAYVRRVILNELLDERRLWARRRDRALPALTVEAYDMDLTDRIDLWSALQSLPPRQRAVMVLRYYEDLSEDQIATQLGCSRGTVKSQAHNALKTLRKRIVPDEEASR
ncbi:MAG TPA: SigE family RNA polymerase sigma factor [Marmoricola sp.]|nr:SigE family RNA polymerase sigma factor [Marmoricola sp.]